MNKPIAIIGATGNVGRKLVELILQRQLIDSKRLKLFASAKSKGSQLTIQEYPFFIEDIADYDFQGCKLALFATGSDVSTCYVPIALSQGAKVIDASSAYRLNPEIPLIVPPVNLDLIAPNHNLIAHANCLASPIAVALYPLHQQFKAKRVIVSTYQSVSGAGKASMDELYQETKSVYEGRSFENRHFQRPMAFNLIPQVSEILNDGLSYEEFKIIRELQKIISSDIQIAATSVRVPVMVGHGIALAIEFERSISVEDALAVLSTSKGIEISPNNYTTPREAEGKNSVFVGRIRKDSTVESGLLLWLVSDNLRRGAALDAVEIAERMLTFP